MDWAHLMFQSQKRVEDQLTIRPGEPQELADLVIVSTSNNTTMIFAMPNDLQKWSYDNWLKVPSLLRNDCIGLLRDKVPKEYVALWKEQHRAGQKIGSNDTFFHLGVGMSVRNLLRDQLLDSELPDVIYGSGANSVPMKNWDDYYLGALQEFIEHELIPTRG